MAAFTPNPAITGFDPNTYFKIEGEPAIEAWVSSDGTGEKGAKMERSITFNIPLGHKITIDDYRGAENAFSDTFPGVGPVCVLRGTDVSKFIVQWGLKK